MWFNYMALAFHLFAISFFMVGSYSLYTDSNKKGEAYCYLAMAGLFSYLSVMQLHRIIEGMIANA